jgi:hypothetical protein
MKYWLGLVFALAISQTALAAGFFDDVIRSTNWQTTIGKAVDKAVTTLPANVQANVPKLREDLKKLSYEDLAALYYNPNPCSLPAILNCNGVASSDAQAFVRAEYDTRQKSLTTSASNRTFYIASGSLVVSVFALLIGAIGRRETRGNRKRS